MSIIEEAVRKSALKRNKDAAAPAAPREGRERARHVPASAELAQARRFQPVTLDPEALDENFVLTQINDMGALRAYKILRTRLLRRLEANQWHSFVITGVTAGEGKTLTAINLAMALAQDVSTWVFLVDLDLQRPRVADYLGLHNTQGEQGLSDYLLGDATLENITYCAGLERLAVIPNFQPLSHSSELLTSPRMLELLQLLEAEVPRRLVVIDMPPLLASDDVLAFSPQVDGVLLVVAEGTTDRVSLRRAKEVLAEMNLLGVVLNRSEERLDQAYYSYAR